MTKGIKDYLFGRDLRSIGQVDKLIPGVKTQSNFDALLEYLHSENRTARDEGGGCGRKDVQRMTRIFIIT